MEEELASVPAKLAQPDRTGQEALRSTDEGLFLTELPGNGESLLRK